MSPNKHATHKYTSFFLQGQKQAHYTQIDGFTTRIKWTVLDNPLFFLSPFVVVPFSFFFFYCKMLQNVAKFFSISPASRHLGNPAFPSPPPPRTPPAPNFPGLPLSPVRMSKDFLYFLYFLFTCICLYNPE